jgi:tetratricopeptide (TPR) repeat protein
MDTQTPDLQAVVERQCRELVERLEKVERQNRRLKVAGGVGVALVIVGAIMLACALGCAKRRSDPRALILLTEAEEQMRRADGICNWVLPSVSPDTTLPPPPESPEELGAVLDKAVVLLKQALEIDPRLHRARLCLATVYIRGGEFAEAIPWAEAFHRALPDDSDGVFILVLAYRAAKKWDALIKFCGPLVAKYDEYDPERSTEINPEFFAEMVALGWLRKGDLKKAEEWATRAIDMDPERSTGYYIRADVQKASGDEAGYEKSLQTAQRLDREAKKKRLEILESESSQSEQETEGPEEAEAGEE